MASNWIRTVQRRALPALALLLGCALAATAQAQAWPTRPVKLIVPYPAGGNSDIIGRLIADKLSQALGQSVVVDNRPGAGAMIGAQAAAKAAPDGYTLLLAPTAVVAITQHMRKLPFDPEAELLPIASLSSSYGVAAARADLPASNMAERLALARKDPGKLSFGSAGSGTATHIAGEIVNLRTGVRILHVPFKGSAEALNDLLAGRIDLIYDPIATAQAKAGKLKILASTASVRHPEFPAVPTLKEQGIDFPGGSWFGLFAPRGTPPEILRRVAAEAERAMKAPGIDEQLVKIGQYVDFRGTEAFARTIRDDSAFYKKLVESAGIMAE